MKHGAIFDMDGTLFDTEKFYRQAWVETADFFGVERKPTIGDEMGGVNFAQAMNIFAKYYPQLDGKKYFDKVFSTANQRADNDLKFLPGAKEIIEFFASKKVSMAIASGSYHATIDKNLRRMGVREFFSAIVGGDDIVNGKPAPDIFLKAAAELNLAPNDCYVFEDSFNGIIAAHRAGCVPVMIPNQLEPTDDVRKICAGVYKNFFEAIDALDRQEI